MTRLRRAAILAVAVAALTAGPALTASATTGDQRGGADMPEVEPTHRVDKRRAVTDSDVVVDRGVDRVADAASDRVTDRTRVRQCDRVTDRVDDCRPTDDRIRPKLARCIEYVQSQTDHTIRRSLRWWWNVCHRLAWNHAHPA